VSRGSGVAAVAGLFAAAVLSLALAFGVPQPSRSPESPASEARLFAPGVLSTADDEIGITFTPDGKTAYFTKRSPTTSTRPVQVICVSRFVDGRWSKPEVAPFSGRYADWSPTITRDGSRLFFSSYRPTQGAEPKPDSDLWVMERNGGGWGEPKNLGPPVDTGKNEQNASIASDGTLYFASDREGGKGSFDIYRSRWDGSKFGPPENLGDTVNTTAYDAQPAIAPDQSFLVFASLGRPEIPLTGGFPYPRADLYLSVRRDAVWQPARRLGPEVNTPATESNPSLAPDGKRLFFTSERGFPEIPMPSGLTHERLEANLRGILNGRGNLYEIGLDRLGVSTETRP
jgi:hypothetical protein